MPRPNHIELGIRRDRTCIPILYEDRSVMAIDKPAGWMLVPFNWQRTRWNLQAAMTSSIRAGRFWARSRNLKFLHHIHRLDAETTGILLFGKSPGVLETLSDLFETRRMQKRYLAVVQGQPRHSEWMCQARLAPDPRQFGRMQVDPKNGKEAVTVFRVVEDRPDRSLVEARPVTGRTHQIRVHLAQAGHPIWGDPLYGTPDRTQPRSRPAIQSEFPMGLRAVALGYVDPFRHRRVHVEAPINRFLKAFGFESNRV